MSSLLGIGGEICSNFEWMRDNISEWERWPSHVSHAPTTSSACSRSTAGGFRGLSALMIVRQLLEDVTSDALPKPCDYSDTIGGTSTGLFLAMMGLIILGLAADWVSAFEGLYSDDGLCFKPLDDRFFACIAACPQKHERTRQHVSSSPTTIESSGAKVQGRKSLGHDLA